MCHLPGDWYGHTLYTSDIPMYTQNAMFFYLPCPSFKKQPAKLTMIFAGPPRPLSAHTHTHLQKHKPHTQSWRRRDSNSSCTQSGKHDALAKSREKTKNMGKKRGR